MCARAIGLIAVFLTILPFHTAGAIKDLSEFKATCTELGFKPSTRDHGNCVITLLKKQKSNDQAPTSVVRSTGPSGLEVELLNQQRLQLQKEQLEIQKQMLEEAKRQRQLQALGAAQRGLEFAYPKTNTEQKQNNSSVNGIWCGNYGVNTICSSN